MSKIDFLKEQIIEARTFVNRLMSELPEDLWIGTNRPTFSFTPVTAVSVWKFCETSRCPTCQIKLEYSMVWEHCIVP